jgi:hypothetical protein
VENRAEDRLVAGPEMRYKPETARRGRKSALPESSERSERSERKQKDYDQQRWQPLGYAWLTGAGTEARGAHADPLDG